MNKDLVVRNILLLNELINLDRKVDFDFIVFKGAGLLLRGLYDISQRQMSDVDIFIRNENYDKFVDIIKEMGYLRIENGENSFYKVIMNNFPPVILDLHTSFFSFSYDDICFVKLDGYKNLRVLCDEDMFLFLAIHSILNHGFFDEKTKNDLKIILDNNKDENFLKKVVLKASKFGFSYIITRVLINLGFNFNYSLGFKDLVSLPFVEISLKKHFILNEYILMLIYKPCKLIDFLKKPSKFKNVFMRLLNKMD